MNTQTKLTEGLLDPSLKLRPAHWADLNAVAQLMYDACAADGDTILAMTPEEIKHDWETPGFSLGTDAFVIETKRGRVVGYEEVVDEYGHARLRMDGYVHPDFKGLGIGTALLRTLEQRAREIMVLSEPDVRVTLSSTVDNRDPDSHSLHQTEGYQRIRYHWRMEIVLENPPQAPKFPERIEIRPFIQGEHDIAVWQAQNEAWRDHWGSHDVTFEEWRRSRFDDPEFDPTLWQIAWDGNDVAGFSLNRYRMGIGWIRTLGVRRPWRKRGLGEALLRASFVEFYRRGTKTIGLGVDAQSPTGATRLYQRVGMRAASEHVTYQKELRSGREPDRQD
jgi:mycothiol synthase